MSAFEGEMLGNLKARLTEITDLIDSHDEKMLSAKNELIYAQSELEKTEADLANTKRRIDLLSIDFKDAGERLAVNEKRLKELEDSTEKIEEQRDKLDEAEGQLDEENEELETKKNDMKREVERTEFTLSSEERRLVVVKRDTERATSKANMLEERATILEATLLKADESCMEMEEREEEAYDREDLNECKIEFLEGQCHENEIRADIAERACASVERVIIDIENEMNHWKRKVQALVAEMEAMDQVAKIEADIDENEMKIGLENKARRASNGNVEATIKTD